MSILQSALAPHTWPFPPSDLPESAYLVGGCVRDALLQRQTAYVDLDFVLPEAVVETAQRIAQRYQAGFVLLDAHRQIARVVFAQATADFALQVGSILEKDLHRRDFTMNAIAYHPFSDTIIDPLAGQADIQAGVVRMIATQNLEEDPLRLLRAYRQAAQLGFVLDPQTQASIRQLAPQLATVAAERIKVELSYLLSDPKATPWVVQLWQDGLLKTAFPHATLEHIALLPALDEAAAFLAEETPVLARILQQTLNEQAQGKEAAQRTLLATTKLTGLVSEDLTLAEANLQQMKFSQAEINGVIRVLKCWKQLLTLTVNNSVSRRDQYYLFQQAGSTFPAAVLRMIASQLVPSPATDPLPLTPHSLLERLTPWIAEYLNPQSLIAHPQPPLSGRVLIQELKLSPGPEIGKLLTQLTLAQAEGQISTPAEALRFAQKILSFSNSKTAKKSDN
ncbi:MAG: CCA tRNA nucleotidyltransferase [Acaryochloris sp. RU_4_1]|nr:CCA tRNA nucleotidyltransferase [Acaryochloris sp. RU_4_1]NJR54799.1 CCA tRNA nucleotidyltransferase [Acaryochloris sp. CRU_2_0]